MCLRRATVHGHPGRTMPWLDATMLNLFDGPIVEHLAPWLNGILESSSTMMDLGCGNGEKTAYVRGTARAVGVDIDRNVLISSRTTTSGVLLVQADATALPFRDSTMDAVFSFGLLQLVDWRLALAECARVSKPAAPVALVANLKGNPVVAPYRWLARHLRFEYPSHQVPREHLTWNDVSAFDAVLEVKKVVGFHILTPLACVGPLLLNGRGAPASRIDVLAYRFLAAVDRLLMKLRLGRYAWMVLVQARAR